MPTIRVASVGYLNALPLVEGLDREPAVTLELATPAEVAERLASGAADLGLVPVIEAAR